MTVHTPGGSGLSFSLDSTTDEPIADKSTNGAAHIFGLASKGVSQTAGTYNTTEVLGYRVVVAGTGDWTAILKNGGTITIPAAAMILGEVYPEHLSSITVGTGGTALLYIPS
jgi:hypothetical protein